MLFFCFDRDITELRKIIIIQKNPIDKKTEIVLNNCIKKRQKRRKNKKMAVTLMVVYIYIYIYREFYKNNQELHSKNKECGYRSFFESFSESNTYKKTSVKI